MSPEDNIREYHTRRIDIPFVQYLVHLPHPAGVIGVYDDSSVFSPVLYVTDPDWCRAGCIVLLSYSVMEDGTVQNVCR